MIGHEVTRAPFPPRATASQSLARVVVAALIALLLVPAPAFAHAHLKKTSPAAGARLTAVPTQLVLTFSEAPALAVSVLRLLGPDSAPVALGTLTHDAGPLTITSRITGALKAGRYTVEWQTAGDDGHVQHGSFTFTIAEGATGIAATASTPSRDTSATRTFATVPGSMTVSVPFEPPVSAAESAVRRGDTGAGGFGASSVLYVVIRWVQFAALLLVIGAVAFRWWVLPRGAAGLGESTRLLLSASAATAGLRGAWLLALSTLARLAAQIATMHALPGASPSVSGLLTGTAWGHGWLLEVVALVVVIAALRRGRHDGASTGAWQAAATATVALAYVPAMSGHAIADRTFAPFTLLLDGVHVLAGGAWLGTLAVLLVVGIPVAWRTAGTDPRNGARRILPHGMPDPAASDAVSRMVNAFSPLALTCAAILVFTGIVAARVHVASWAAFTDTS